MNNEKIEADVRDNKVKEGLLLKQSRHLKQWKERWMVLTKTHLYSFLAKGQYKDPTEIIPLKDIQTTKSYYKDQYKKPFTFRIESPDVNFHMSAKSSDEKWAWMTAIQKMIQRVIHPEQKTDTYNLIRQTIKMSTAVRQTLQKKQQKQRKQSTDFTNHLLRKIKMRKQIDVCSYQYIPDLNFEKKLSLEEETFFVIDKKPPAKDNKNVGQKVVDKKVEVPTERVVERIVKVPEIVQKIIQKIVYRDPPHEHNNNLSQILKTLICTPNQNHKPLVNFVVYLLTSKLEQYQSQILQFCLDPQARRFFAQVFLLMMNQGTSTLKKKPMNKSQTPTQNSFSYFMKIAMNIFTPPI